MIIYKHGTLSKKEKDVLRWIVSSIPDTNQDFYITKDNQRIFLDINNLSLLYNCVRHGDRIIYSEEEGLICVLGFSDENHRKYIKILAKDNYAASKLLKVLFWNVKNDLWIKIKKSNPLNYVLKENKFLFRGSRGKEILLCREKRSIKE